MQCLAIYKGHQFYSIYHMNISKIFVLEYIKNLEKVFLGWLNVKHMHVVFEVGIKELYPAYCFVYHTFKTVSTKMSRDGFVYPRVVTCARNSEMIQ